VLAASSEPNLGRATVAGNLRAAGEADFIVKQAKNKAGGSGRIQGSSRAPCR